MPVLNPLNQYSAAFPVLECIHIVGIACGVGTAALVNLRLLGVGPASSRLWSRLTPWTLGGLTLAILSGLLLFSIDPEKYYGNGVFRLKMLLLLLAIVFYFTVVRRAVRAETRGTVVALTSLSLWTMVPFAGIFIGFTGSTAYAYPILVSIHVVSFVLLGGVVVAGYSRVPVWIAFGLAAASGGALFAAHIREYSGNPWFWLKMSLLVLLAVNYLVWRKTKVASALSLVLWIGVIFAARGPATIKDVMHSMIDPSADFLFQSVQTIADEQGIREIAPHTGAEWDDVRQRLMVLLETPDLLRGRRAARTRDRSINPEVESQPEEIQKLLDAGGPDLLRLAQRLQDAASVAMKAVDAKDKDALLLGLDRIDKACESCHLHYWYPNDQRAREAAKEDGLIE